MFPSIYSEAKSHKNNSDSLFPILRLLQTRSVASRHAVSNESRPHDRFHLLQDNFIIIIFFARENVTAISIANGNGFHKDFMLGNNSNSVLNYYIPIAVVICSLIVSAKNDLRPNNSRPLGLLFSNEKQIERKFN